MKDPACQTVDIDYADNTFVQVLMAVYEDFKDLEGRLAKHLSSYTGNPDGGASSIDKTSFSRS